MPTEGPAYLTKPLKAKVSQRGLYRLLRSNGLVDDDRTSTGKTLASPIIELVKLTDHVPLIKGGQMQMQFRIWSFPDYPAHVDLRRVLKHPPMSLPDGTVSTGSDYMMKGRVRVNQVIAYTGYSFDEDYEMVAGEWIFEIWYQEKKLVEQHFTTYVPSEEEVAAFKL